MMSKMRRWVLALGLISVAAGCGPIAYVKGVTYNADDAVESARAAQADKYSPYYWTRATQYLHMSREVAAHADFQGANKFGRLAAEAAKLAEEEARDPNKRPVNPNDVAPAKAKDDAAPEKPNPNHKDLAPAKDAP
jgi:sRNA-binding protein